MHPADDDPTPRRTASSSRWPWLLALGILVAVAAVVVWIVQPFADAGQAIADPAVPGPGAAPSLEDADGAERAAVPVTVARVTRSDLPLVTEATGHLRPWRSTEISADVGGRILERAVEEGQWVEAGTVLLRLDRREAEIELAEARSDLLRARADFAVEYGVGGEPDEDAEARGDDGAVAAADLEAARRDVAEKERLVEEGLLPREELERSRQRLETLSLLGGLRREEVQEASSGLAQAEQRLQRARLALDRTRVEAPFAGRVADVEVEEGQRITAGQDCLELLDDSRLQVEVEVLEEDVVRLGPGAPVTVRIPSLDDLELDGTIHSINPRVDPERGTGRLTVALPNRRGRLLAGLFALVRLETGLLEERLSVPAEAVLDRDGREVVFRVEDGRARWVYVETGARSGDQVEIREGLAVGDVVAVGGHRTLGHNAPVLVDERRGG